MKKIVFIVNIILFVSIFIYSVVQKERLISSGQKMILKLQPVDPRSLMQGDYMRLDFQLANDIENKEKFETKKAIVKLDSKNIGTLKSLYTKGSKLNKNEIVLNFKYKYDRVVIITDAWFFQEGKAKKFEEAKYGEFRIDSSGVGLLVKLLDKDLKEI